MLIKKTDLTALALESGVWEKLCILASIGESASEDDNLNYKIVEIVLAKKVE